MAKAKKKTKLKYGDVEVDSQDLDPKNAKIRITMFVPISLQDAYKKEAAKLGIGYQTLMQMKLKEALEGDFEKRLERLERAMKIKAG